MKVAISYPPIVNNLGQKAMVSQNRNVQYFKEPTYLLPVVHAQAATWLRDLGHDVLWDDGNAQLKTFDRWLSDLTAWNPDVIVLESTTPVMKFYWRTVDRLKEVLPRAIVVMTGYHSMRAPEETLNNSKTDVVLRSNHVDFVLSKLVPSIAAKKDWRLDLKVDGLSFRGADGRIHSTGDFRRVERLENSPLIDRDLIRWKNYAYENGNYLQTPGTYATSVIRDCMFGKCTFCRYNGPELTFSMMPVERSLNEYETLVRKFKAREIFDDSGVWYRGADARRFAQGIIDRGLHKEDCYYGINTRFEYLDDETLKLMGKANFRFILLGLEAADDETLERLNKGYLAENAMRNLEQMTKHGLHPHLTVMVGYYWQTAEQLQKTVDMVKGAMIKGLARTLQVTICTPLDFTPYHNECLQKGVLLAQDYDDHDMSKIIVKTPISHDRYYDAVREMYSIAFSPRFILRQLRFLLSFRKRDWQFLFTYGWRAVRRVRQHMFNLTRNRGSNGCDAVKETAPTTESV